jgi:hypothetical protein
MDTERQAPDDTVHEPASIAIFDQVIVIEDKAKTPVRGSYQLQPVEELIQCELFRLARMPVTG